MTELAVQGDGEIERPPEQRSALVQWAYEADQAHKIAQSLARTSFVPQSLRGKPDDITAAILAGQELGLPPMATLRSMDVIQGTPALRAHAMRGLVQSKGHEVVLVESTPEHCTMRGRRRDTADWQEIEWDLARAERLGLTGKSEWKKQPQTMLVARATGEICRLIAADVLFAMPYASEELDETAVPAATTGPRVTAAEILAEEPAVEGAEPESDPDADAVEQVADEAPSWPEPTEPWGEQ